MTVASIAIQYSMAKSIHLSVNMHVSKRLFNQEQCAVTFMFVLYKLKHYFGHQGNNETKPNQKSSVLISLPIHLSYLPQLNEYANGTYLSLIILLLYMKFLMV